MKRVILFIVTNMMKNFNLLLFLLIELFNLANSIPRRGNEPWSLILCKFAELPTYEPKSKEWFREWLSGPNYDSIENFFSQVSNNVYTIKGSTVHGWYQIIYTQNDVRKLANSNLSDPIGSDSSFDYFDKIEELCVERALEDGARLYRQKIIVINSGTTAVFSKKYGVLLTPKLLFSSVLTHEIMHSFFIGHSYSDRKIKIFPYALYGEYDDRYDLMSTANAYMHRSKYGLSGPGLNGAHLDFLGWLPMNRILYFGRDGQQNYTLRLSSLSIPHNETNNWLYVMIPYDRDDPNNYYTIELRTANRFDKGIFQTSILIHQIQKIGKSYYSVLLSHANHFYELTENNEWVKFLETNANEEYQFIRVLVKKIYQYDADISIISTFNPNSCRSNEIIQPIIIKNDSLNLLINNKLFKESIINLKYVCLEKMRTIIETDLIKQLMREKFYLLKTFGANACRTGYLWRSLDEYDYVCVLPNRFNSLSDDLSQQKERISSNGFDCKEPYMARRAFPTDNVCVSLTEKIRTFRENIHSTLALQHFAFFNGVDTVGP